MDIKCDFFGNNVVTRIATEADKEQYGYNEPEEPIVEEPVAKPAKKVGKGKK